MAAPAVPADDSALRLMVASVLVQHGPSAFEMPRYDAAIHEAGHALVFAVHGEPVTKIRIFSQRCGNRVAWGGETIGAGAWKVDIDSELDSDLRVARFMLAGIVAETIYHRGNHRKGSSLDELVGAQRICGLVALKTGERAAEVYRTAITDTDAVLKSHWPEALRIANALQKHQEVAGKRLDALLVPVRDRQ